jgi:predicted RNase H-like nuclease (RuvC/YqgF family)
VNFFNLVINFIVKYFWPWFIEFIWPIIKDHVKDLIIFIIGKLLGIVKEWFEEVTQKRKHQAESNAEQAENKAETASSDAEADKYRAVAKVWREVAEQFRIDNENLKNKLYDLETEARTVSEKMVDDMKIDVDFSKEKAIVTIDKNEKEIPLPNEKQISLPPSQ